MSKQYIFTYNMGDGPDYRKRRDINQMIAAGAVIICFQETGDRKVNELLPPGWKTFGSSPQCPDGASSVVVAWNDNAVSATSTKSIVAVPSRWVGPEGAGPTRSKQKVINQVVFRRREMGAEAFTVLNTHFIPSVTRNDLTVVEKQSRENHYADHLDAVIRARRNAPTARVVITGDFNAKRTDRVLYRLRRTGIKGWSLRGTHGKRAIDHVLGLRGFRKYLNLSSDHKAVGAKLP